MQSEDKNVLLQVVEKLAKIEEKMDAVPHDVHNEQHDYVALLMEREELKNEFWRGVVEKLATAGIFGVISLIVSVIVYAVRQFTGH